MSSEVKIRTLVEETAKIAENETNKKWLAGRLSTSGVWMFDHSVPARTSADRKRILDKMGLKFDFPRPNLVRVGFEETGISGGEGLIFRIDNKGKRVGFSLENAEGPKDQETRWLRTIRVLEGNTGFEIITGSHPKDPKGTDSARYVFEKLWLKTRTAKIS